MGRNGGNPSHFSSAKYHHDRDKDDDDDDDDVDNAGWVVGWQVHVWAGMDEIHLILPLLNIIMIMIRRMMMITMMMMMRVGW